MHKFTKTIIRFEFCECSRQLLSPPLRLDWWLLHCSMFWKERPHSPRNTIDSIFERPLKTSRGQFYWQTVVPFVGFHHKAFDCWNCSNIFRDFCHTLKNLALPCDPRDSVKSDELCGLFARWAPSEVLYLGVGVNHCFIIRGHGLHHTVWTASCQGVHRT